MSGGQDKKKKVETNGHIDLDERTQIDLKNMVQAMHIARVRPEEWQERIDILIRSTVYANGKKENYEPSNDFTQLIKSNG